MTIAFRILTRCDAGELANLHGQGFETSWSSDSLSALLELPTCLGIGGVLDQGSDLCGFALFQHVENQAELLTLAVRPDARRRGLARALLANGEQHLAARGCTRLFLEVAADNEAALALYRQLDFRLEGHRRKYYSRADGDDADALIMSRVITGLPE
ncbi:MAG: GNAT family N-acetyltransferase [Pseudomonadota bacterium]